IYDMTIGQMYLYYMLIAWICILSLALIGAFINSIMQTTYTSLVISSLIIVIPMFMKDSEYLSNNIQKFLYLQPINGVSLLSFIDSLFSYSLCDSRVLLSTAIIIFAIVCSIICMSLSPFIF